MAEPRRRPESAPSAEELDALEVSLLLEGVFRRTGIDFREYAPASIRRRVHFAMRAEGLATVSALQDAVLHDERRLERLVHTLTVHSTAMFRDPSFYRAVRAQVVPLLRTWPSVRIWCAGCASGEEVHSLAILLEEEGLLDRCRIYATDLSESVLERARAGEIPFAAVREYAANYVAAGGKRSFSAYATVESQRVVLRPALRKRVVYSVHDLATDRSFNEFHLILCRNVLIYFNRALEARVHRLLFESLVWQGFLGLGLKESVRGSPHAEAYDELNAAQRLYVKVRG